LFAAAEGHRKVLKFLLPLSTMTEAEVGERLTPEVRAKLSKCSGCSDLKMKLKVCGSVRYW